MDLFAPKGVDLADAQQAGFNELESFLVIKDIQLVDLFHLDYFRAPRPYLIVRAGTPLSCRCCLNVLFSARGALFPPFDLPNAV